MGVNFKLYASLVASMLITEAFGVLIFYLSIIGAAFVIDLIPGNKYLGGSGFVLAFYLGILGVIAGIIITPIIFIRLSSLLIGWIARMSFPAYRVGSVMSWIIIAVIASAILQGQVWDKLIAIKNVRYGLTFIIFNTIFFIFALKQYKVEKQDL